MWNCQYHWMLRQLIGAQTSFYNQIYREQGFPYKAVEWRSTASKAFDVVNGMYKECKN